VVKMKHCCKNVVILMPEPVAEPALNGLRLNLRIVSIVMFNFPRTIRYISGPTFNGK
jgi:hypothetical protein